MLKKISILGNRKFGNMAKWISQIQEQLTYLKVLIPNKTTIEHIKGKEKELNDILIQEEVWWAKKGQSSMA